jgi:phospholipid/cholesterol/gamma-HCH transport system substrate-binding protein
MRGLAAPLIKLTIFIVVTVLFTAILGISIANISTSDSKDYSARFSDATLVLAGDDVRIAGVKVGQVTDVKIVDRRQAQIDFQVDSNRTLPSNVHATIRYRNLVGQRYISLTQGTEGDDAKPLKPGGTIPIDQTTPALDLDQLFNGFRPLFAALNPDDVNKLSYEIIQVFQGEGGTIESLLSHTASLTTTIAQKDQVIGQVIDNLNGVLDTVNARTPQLSDLIVRLQQLVSGLAQDRKPIGDAIDALGGLANTTSGLLEKARDPLKNDIAALGVLSNNLNDNQALVEHFIQYLPEKATRLTATADYGSWFNFFLCSTQATINAPILPSPIAIPVQPSSQPRCKA